jgi:hypothetical protein
MIWASIDPASKSGIAYWKGSELYGYGVIRPVGATGKHKAPILLRAGGVVLEDYPTRHDAWKMTLAKVRGLVIEEGFGRFTNAVKAQAHLRGYIEAVWDSLARGNPVTVVNVSEWRRVIKEAYDVSWPKDSKRCKAMSVFLVKDVIGLTVTDDEADAILLGVAAVRMRLVDL